MLLITGAPALGTKPRRRQATLFIDQARTLRVVVSHPFARSEAADRLAYLLAYWKSRFNISSQWRGGRVFVSGSVYGVEIEALFAIGDSSIVAIANDPGWPWTDKVGDYVDRKLKKYLHPTYDDS